MQRNTRRTIPTTTLVLGFLVSGLLVSGPSIRTANGDIVVAEFTTFSGSYLADGGDQIGFADLDALFGGSITDGSSLSLLGNHGDFNAGSIDIGLSGVGLVGYRLRFDVTRSDGPGANAAPNLLSISYSADGNPFQVVSSHAIALGANSYDVDLSGHAPLDAASTIVFRTTFSGAAGGLTSSLSFDNIQVSATAIPEPGGAIVGIAASLFGLGFRRRTV